MSSTAAQKAQKRNTSGLKEPWKPGQSGNPAGRPKRAQEVAELFRGYTQEACDALVRVMRDPESPPSAIVTAATTIVERGWGKPAIDINARVKHNIEDFTDDELAVLAGLGGAISEDGTAAPAESTPVAH